ncbi:MobA/MobL family protein [Moraxella osloensis]|uniref:MobA/MobL family protein n=1 Tax=Faucicola osloensis TaxID=34062 RepID=UPI00200492B7|nr:MobA/MobL family protein [Moraxella osloensis]
MATTKSITRSKGQSAVASAAYRSGKRLEDKRYGKIQDYSSRAGILSTDIILPNSIKNQSSVTSIDRQTLWNAAESAEKRKDSRVAREWIVNLPFELPEDERKRLAHEFSQSLCDKYGVVADCCLHRPSEKEVARGADPRNFHAHIMLTTRQVALDDAGKIILGDKTTIELSDTKRRSLGLSRVDDEIVELRQLWEQIANRYLTKYGIDLIDCRSYADRELDIIPEVKMGKEATQMERDGIATEKGDINRAIRERNAKVKALYEQAINSSEYRIAETERATVANARTANDSQQRIDESQRVIDATSDDITSTAQFIDNTKLCLYGTHNAYTDNPKRIATTQSAIDDTKQLTTGAEQAVARNTAESTKRAEQLETANRLITVNTERTQRATDSIELTTSINAAVVSTAQNNTRRADKSQQRVTESEQRIDDHQRNSASTDSFINRTKSAIARFIETTRRAYAWFSRRRKLEQEKQSIQKTSQNASNIDSKGSLSTSASVVAPTLTNEHRGVSTLNLNDILLPADQIAEQKIKELKLKPAHKAVQYLQTILGDTQKIVLLDSYLDMNGNNIQANAASDLKHTLFKQILDNTKLAVSNNNSHIHSSERLVIVKTLQLSLDKAIKHFEPNDLSEYQSELTKVTDSMRSQFNMLNRGRGYRL